MFCIQVVAIGVLDMFMVPEVPTTALYVSLFMPYD
jgi:hypothetical protein